jgi:putative hydrolase of the HAD superfamily
MQRLALFDLDNTLIDRDAAFRLWARETVNATGGGEADVDWLVGIDAHGYHLREDLFAELQGRFGGRVGGGEPLRPFGGGEPLERLLERYNARMAELVTIRPAVLAALDGMRASGWRLGIVTNGMPRGQLAKVAAVGLLDHVDACVVAGAEGFHKPDVRLFEIAARRCGVSLVDGGWMIGDSCYADVWGGGRAGLCTIWVRSASAPAEAQPDHVVDDVLAAFEILGRVEL